MAVQGTETEAVMGQPALSLNEGKSWTLAYFLHSAVAGQDPSFRLLPQGTAYNMKECLP